jgi:hypothetical protein
MRMLVLVLPMLLACGHGEGGGDVWDFRVETFATAKCRNTCVPAQEQDSCFDNTVQSLTSNRQFLNGEGEAACLRCMKVQIDLFPAIAQAGCTPTQNQLQQMLATCDTDRAIDSDFDGDPTNDLNAACEPNMFPGGGGDDDEPPPIPVDAPTF